MTVEELLKAYREQADLSQRQFAQKCNLSNGYISMLEKGVNPKTNLPVTPTIPALKKIAKGMGISLHKLLSMVDDMPIELPISEEAYKFKNPTVTTDTVTLPVIGNIAAGYNEIALEDWSGETVEVPLSYLKGRNKNEFIVLKVHGDSMFPEYHNGDKVVILKQASLPRSGSIGAVLYDGETATLKRIEFYEDKIKLIPLNPTFPPKTISGPDCEQVHIIGIPKVLIREIEE